MNPWLGIVCVLASLTVLIGMLRLFGSILTAELSRKIAHICMGLICLSFPWLFDSAWAVFLLAGMAVAGLGSVRCFSFLNVRFGSVLGGVRRVSFGELYFPVAVALVFWLSEGNKLLYCVPVLMLTLADATGALVGNLYGRHRYETSDGGGKSWEGSFAFFCVAFFCAHIPVLLFSQTGRLESVLIGVLLAGLVMLAEAASWRGLDNLFIPVATYGLLQQYLEFDATVLIERTVMLAGVLALALWLRRRLTLNGGALALAVIMCYACGALGGWRWLLAPLTVFVAYTLPFAKRFREEAPRNSVDSVLCVAFGALAWLFTAKFFDHADFLFPFTAWLTASFSIIITIRLVNDYPKYTLGKVMFTAVAWPIALCLLPFVFLSGYAEYRLWILIAFCIPLIAAVVFVFFHWEKSEKNKKAANRYLLQTVCAGTVSLLAYYMTTFI